MSPANSAENPFGEIALCLSGGGYRAAAFHLGMMKMLHELDLLKDVKRFSTASGGTIMAVKYVSCRIEGQEFDDFFLEFKKFLKEVNVVQIALDNLYTAPNSSDKNDLSLIRVAAGVYEKHLFGQKHPTFKQMLDDVVTTKNFHDLIFNSTDFCSGNAFRFRAKSEGRIIIGSDSAHLPLEVAAEIRLADIVAASSCFPGAFEPMRFPEDFVWKDKDKIKKLLEPTKIKSVPLMDGGIYDNQGVDSMTVSFKKSGVPVPFGLMIVSDTCQRDEEFLEFPIVERQGFIPIKAWWWLAVLFFVAVGVSWLMFLPKILTAWGNIFPLGSPKSNEAIWFYLIPFALETIALIVFGVVCYLWTTFKVIEISFKDFTVWDYIKNLTLSDLKTLVDNRLISVKAMTFEIFMKRIRRMTIEKTKANPKFTKLIAFNYIYDLNTHFEKEKSKAEAERLGITPELRLLSECAETVPTTLWFGEKNAHQLEELIECGQTSACFSLLKYLRKNFSEELKIEDSKYKKFYDYLLTIWQKRIKAENRRQAELRKTLTPEQTK
jgi:predicted acylesterase/phospholipase RssA